MSWRETTREKANGVVLLNERKGTTARLPADGCTRRSGGAAFGSTAGGAREIGSTKAMTKTLELNVLGPLECEEAAPGHAVASKQHSKWTRAKRSRGCEASEWSPASATHMER